MIINNKIDDIYVSVIEDVAYAEASFTVHKIGVADCVVNTPEISGAMDENGKAVFKIPDGVYRIYIIPNDPNFVTLEQDFLVIYNFLPYLIEYVEETLCKGEDLNCSSCGEISIKEVHENFFKSVLYLTCKGILPELKLLRKSNCDTFKILDQEEELLSFYGRFNFDFKEKIKEFFVYLYVDLYQMHFNSIKETEDTLLPVFNFDTIKKCMYKLGFSYEDLICKLDNLKCDCDE